MRGVKMFAKMALIVPLVGLTTTGCGTGSGGGSENSKTVINFWYTWGGPGQTEMQKLINEFNKSQNKVFVKGLALSDEQKEMTAIVGHNPPDLASQWDENLLASWASKGAMMPLDSFIENSHYDTSDYLPVTLKAVQYNGHIYALPMAMNVWMLYYNKTLFKQAGITEPPKTVQEMMADAKKLTKFGSNGEMTQVGMPADTLPYQLTPCFGGSLWDPKTKQVTPDNPGFKAAVEFDQSLWKLYGVNNYNHFVSAEGASGQDPFLTGKMGMEITGEWEAQAAQQNAPNLKYGIAPLPYDADNPQTKGNGFTNVNILYIPQGAKHPDAAWEFMKWLEAKQQMIEFDAVIGNLVPRKSAVGDPTINSIPGFKFAMNYALSPEMSVLPQLPFMDEYQSVMSTETDKIFRGKESVDQGIQNIKSTIQPLVQSSN